jgi:hypothetical protein
MPSFQGLTIVSSIIGFTGLSFSDSKISRYSVLRCEQNKLFYNGEWNFFVLVHTRILALIDILISTLIWVISFRRTYVTFCIKVDVSQLMKIAGKSINRLLDSYLI